MSSTWSRNLPRTVVSYRYLQGAKQTNSGTYQDSGQVSLSGGDQTTESYRSGKSVAGVAVQEEYTSTSGSQVDFAKRLRDEDRGDLGRGTYDNGHDFSTVRNSILWPSTVTARNPSGPLGNVTLVGWVPVNVTSPTWPPMSYPSQATKVANGSKLMGLCAPTTPEVGLAAFLGELREGLPKVIGLESLLGGPTARNLGSEHLNVQFGVKPLISDLKKTARGILDFHKRVDQMKRDSGRHVRRRAELSADSTSTDRGTVSSSSLSIPYFYGANIIDQYYTYIPPTGVVDNYSSEVWFSGAFQYHLAEAHSFLGKLERYEQLAQASLGTRFDESTAWQLTPWSWMVDWFADVGGFIHNVDTFSNDNLVMKYGYVMHRTKCVRVYTTAGAQLRPGAVAPTTVVTYFTSEKKERLRASPYGFGVDLSGLSPRRLAILGALGLTKAPGKLKGLG